MRTNTTVASRPVSNRDPLQNIAIVGMGTTLATSAVCSDNYSSPPDGLGAEEVPVREKSGVDVTLLPEQLTSKYEVVDNLGSGSFGAVYKVRDLKTKVVYAAKYVENRESDMSEVRFVSHAI